MWLVPFASLFGLFVASLAEVNRQRRRVWVVSFVLAFAAALHAAVPRPVVEIYCVDDYLQTETVQDMAKAILLTRMRTNGD